MVGFYGHLITKGKRNAPPARYGPAEQNGLGVAVHGRLLLQRHRSQDRLRLAGMPTGAMPSGNDGVGVGVVVRAGSLAGIATGRLSSRHARLHRLGVNQLLLLLLGTEHLSDDVRHADPLVHRDRLVFVDMLGSPPHGDAVADPRVELLQLGAVEERVIGERVQLVVGADDGDHRHGALRRHALAGLHLGGGDADAQLADDRLGQVETLVVGHELAQDGEQQGSALVLRPAQMGSPASLINGHHHVPSVADVVVIGLAVASPTVLLACFDAVTHGFSFGFT